MPQLQKKKKILLYYIYRTTIRSLSIDTCHNEMVAEGGSIFNLMREIIRERVHVLYLNVEIENRFNNMFHCKIKGLIMNSGDELISIWERGRRMEHENLTKQMQVFWYLNSIDTLLLCPICRSTLLGENVMFAAETKKWKIHKYQKCLQYLWYVLCTPIYHDIAYKDTILISKPLLNAGPLNL